jgi:hypothetical protein
LFIKKNNAASSAITIAGIRIMRGTTIHINIVVYTEDGFVDLGVVYVCKHSMCSSKRSNILQHVRDAWDTVRYKKQDLVFKAHTIRFAYVHHIVVDVDGTPVTIERDEEGNFRALVDAHLVQASKIEVWLVEALVSVYVSSFCCSYKVTSPATEEMILKARWVRGALQPHLLFLIKQ